MGTRRTTRQARQKRRTTRQTTQRRKTRKKTTMRSKPRLNEKKKKVKILWSYGRMCVFACACALLFLSYQGTLLFCFFGIKAGDLLSQSTYIIVFLLWPSGRGMSIARTTHVPS